MTGLRSFPGIVIDESTSSVPLAVSTILVVDSGVLAVALADDGQDGNHARQHLCGHRLLSVSSTTTEVLGIWRQAVRTGALSTDRIRTALRDLTELPLSLVDLGPMLDRCWELQARVHAHDAAVLALAESIDAPLITTNPKLADLTETSARVVLLH